MRIYSQNFITFKAISLNQNETMCADNLLHSMTNPTQKEQVKLELFDIFDKHIQNEAEVKSGKLYRKEDFLQKLYLTFFVSLETIKSLTVEKLLEILNNTKPNNEEIKEEYRISTHSLNRKLGYNNDRTIESTLSEEKILKPKSAVSPEERLEQRDKILKLARPLSKKEQNMLSLRSSGKTYNQIADKTRKSLSTAHKQTRRAIAKIQVNNNILSKEYELFADKFIKTFDLNLSKDEVIGFIITHIELTSYEIDNLSSNINKLSKLLQIEEKLLIQAALKQPSLFCQKTETLNKNIETTSKLLGIDKKLFTKAALKQPSLFCIKPETINKNIETTSKLLGVDKKLFIIQAALKRPQLFCQKPETINKNIETVSKLLEVDKKSFINAALKHPQLFYQNQKTINKNIETISKSLKIDKKSLIQAALKQPSLFYQKPKTIIKKVNIKKYYKQIQGRNNKQIIFSTSSAKNLYYDILAYLIKKQDKLSRTLKQDEIVGYLKAQNKVYNFTIPKNKLANEFIEYVQEFSQSNFDKQIFNINIK